MQNLYPLFERNRILKKELLWSLRDYSFGHIQLEYQDYAEGIISGCSVTVREGEICIGEGLVKWGGFVYLITETVTIPYKPLDQMQIVKLCMHREEQTLDYIGYGIEFQIDTDEIKGDNQLELCRFHLRRGAKLRDEYTDFNDMQTEYDTVNYLHADWSGLGELTLCPLITRSFASQVMEEENALAEDLAFAWLAKNEKQAVTRDVIVSYCRRKGALRTRRIPDNQQLFEAMAEIIVRIKNGTVEIDPGEKKHRKIIVD